MKTRFFFISLLFSFLFVGLSSPKVYSQIGVNSGNQSKPTTVKSVGKMNHVNGFFVQYSDNLYRGGDITSEEAVIELKEKGITRIISTVENSNVKTFAKKNGVNYTAIPFDAESGLTAKAVKKFLKATQIASDVFFFTGDDGKHKAGLFCAMYRMKYMQWTYEDAMREFIKLGGDPIGDKPYMESVKTLLK